VAASTNTSTVSATPSINTWDTPGDNTGATPAFNTGTGTTVVVGGTVVVVGGTVVVVGGTTTTGGGGVLVVVTASLLDCVPEPTAFTARIRTSYAVVAVRPEMLSGLVRAEPGTGVQVKPSSIEYSYPVIADPPLPPA
jgi:hypothetical protein